MRIAFFVGTFPTLTETWLIDQVVALIARGHDITLFATHPPPGVPWHPIVEREKLIERVRYRPRRAENKTLRILSNFGLMAANISRGPVTVARLMDVRRYGWRAWSGDLIRAGVPLLGGRGNEFDLVHCHHGDLGFLGGALKQIGLIRSPLLTTFYGPDILDRSWVSKNKDYAPLRAAGDRFTVLTKFLRDRAIEIGFAPERIDVIPMGIELDRFPFGERRPDADGSARIITVARLVEFKGIEYGIRAFARVAAKFPKARYQIVGDGPLREHLKAVAVDAGVADRVDFLGALAADRLLPVLGAAHLFMLPGIMTDGGLAEGQGVVLLEAQACGLPVLASNVGGIPENLVPGITAYLTPPKDVDALAERLDFLLSKPETWPAMGRAGRGHVHTNFDNRVLHDRLEAVYREMAPGAR